MTPAFRFERFQQLLLAMAQQRSVAALLRLVTQELAATSDVALIRIWLLQPAGVGCASCHWDASCNHGRRCLALVSSNGRSVVDDTRWDRTTGAFRRLPVGERKVGRIAESGEPLEVTDLDPDADWIADPDWIRRERIRSFGGQPLVHRGDVLGVLALFARARLEADTQSLLRMVADHLASALVNAWSFEDIQRLKQQVELENAFLRREVGGAGEGLVGQSEAIRHIQRQVALVAPTDVNVLITGESGTGKEVIARGIHAQSRRRDRSMIKVNCAAIPKDLFESEFFGHVRGAFTGAERERYGLFHAADGGTLFLDEVSEIPIALQGKLLRVLQEREYRRVGEERDRKVDVRIISASNRDLAGQIRAGTFRGDLYYRLQVFPLEVPPLRERKDDIAPLAAHFLEVAAQRLHRQGLRLRSADLETLMAYHWPGNCRELQNVIERAVITSQSGRLDWEVGVAGRPPPAAGAHPVGAAAEMPEVLTDAALRELDRRNTLAALEKCQWRIYGPAGAGELLGLPPTTLLSRLKRLGIARRHPDSAPVG